MEKLSRDQKNARKNLSKEFDKLFKINVKSRKWEYLKPTAFLHLDDWFVSIDPIISTETRRSEIQIKVKPFALDDLVSRIMLHGSLDGTPLSLRARGPHCLTVPMFSQSIEDDAEQVEAMLQAAESFSETSIERISSLTLNDFIDFSASGPAGKVSVNQVAALILAGRTENALELCEAAITNKQWGGPARVTEDGKMIGFFEFARRWISKR